MARNGGPFSLYKQYKISPESTKLQKNWKEKKRRVNYGGGDDKSKGFWLVGTYVHTHTRSKLNPVKTKDKH